MLIVEDFPERPAICRHLPMSYPTLFHYYVDAKEENWKAWNWVLEPYVHNPSSRFSDILVPTVDTIRNAWLIEQMNAVRIKTLLFF